MYIIFTVEKRGKDWDNIITSHMNDNQAKLWSFQRKAIGNHVLPTKDKSAVKVKIKQLI